MQKVASNKPMPLDKQFLINIKPLNGFSGTGRQERNIHLQMAPNMGFQILIGSEKAYKESFWYTEKELHWVSFLLS